MRVLEVIVPEQRYEIDADSLAVTQAESEEQLKTWIKLDLVEVILKRPNG